MPSADELSLKAKKREQIKKKRKIKRTGFSKQKQLMENVGYYKKQGKRLK